jgi:hypothetical protein
MVRPLDAPPVTAASPSAPSVGDEPAYVYAASDLRPRQPKEIELCEKASHFDWQYTGAFTLAFGASVWANIDKLKHEETFAVRMLGPALVGFTWGALLTGGFLSLPKCDPLWAGGPSPEGNVRSIWPIGTAIVALAALTGPFMDYSFLGPVKTTWAVSERSARVFVASGFGVLGALLPYVLPPRTWAARKQIDRMHVDGTLGGAAMTYTVQF